MKVWNEDIEDCSDCPFQGVGGMDTPICNITYKDIKSSEIHPDCPFNKPITKEDFEGFGFKFDGKIFTLKNDNYLIKVYLITEKHYIFIIDGEYIFPKLKGDGYITLNNPEELKFILTSLNIL